MAVRDDRQPVIGERASGGLPPRDFFSYLPAILVTSGLLMYAYLSICYDRFYGSLGVDPNDVGLTYAGTLAHSSGFAILSLVVLANIPTGVLAFQRDDRRARREDPTAQTPRILVILMVLTSVALIFTALRPPFLSAGYAARYVRTGVPVSPIRVWSIPVLAIHADPATVEPAGKPGDSPAAERLRGRRLLYLGQAAGTVVFYDVAAQQAVYVPANSIILHVANCRGIPPDPACRQP